VPEIVVMPEIVGTLALVPATAKMTSTIGMPERAGTLTTTGMLAKQQPWFLKQVGTLAVIPATAEMTATVGMPERAWTPATVTAAVTRARVGKENFLFLNILFLSVHDN
jgi:hypothetical protein